MRYSLYRVGEAFEAFIIYLVIFTSSSILIHLKYMKIENSFILQSFFKNITDYQLLINIFLTFLMIVFHYQFVNRKKTEIICRILVGDTSKKIVSRYILNSLSILVFSFLLSFLLNVYLKQSIWINLYLLAILVVYILISSGQVRKNENI